MPLRILLRYLAASDLALLIAAWAMLFGNAGLLLTFGGRSQALAVLATTLMTATSLGTFAGIVGTAGRALHIRRLSIFATVFFLVGVASVPYAYAISVINACATNTSFPIAGLDACSR